MLADQPLTGAAWASRDGPGRCREFASRWSSLPPEPSAVPAACATGGANRVPHDHSPGNANSLRPRHAQVDPLPETTLAAGQWALSGQYGEWVSKPRRPPPRGFSACDALLASVFFGISGAGAGLSDLRVS